MIWTLDPNKVGPAIAGMILPSRYSSSVEYSAEIETWIFISIILVTLYSWCYLWNLYNAGVCNSLWVV